MRGSPQRAFQLGVSDVPATVEFDFHPHFSIWSTSDPKFDKQREERLVRDMPSILNKVKFMPNFIGVPLGRMLIRRVLNKVEKVKAELTTVSHMIERTGVKRIDLLKVDVEGAEEDVLMGMADGLDLESPGGIAELKERWSRVGAIVMELHDVDGRLHRVRHLLESVGGFRVDLEQEEVFKGGDAQGVDVWNVLATRDD